MKIGYFTDCHFSMKNQSRLDNTFQTAITKMKESFEWFQKNKCDFVICGGDMFDRHRQMNLELFYKVFQVINNQKLKVYYIMGNHDEMGFRWQTVQKSSVGFIEKLLSDKLILIKDKIELEECNLIACHAGQDIQQISNNVQKSDKPNILIAHCLLADNTQTFGSISINKITNKNIDLVLSGDLHDGYKYQQNKQGIKCYNPGSLVRLSSSDKDRKPKVAIFNVEMLLEQVVIDIKQKVLKHEKSEVVFPKKEQKKQVKKQIESESSYIESFRQFKRKTQDIYELLEKTGKEHGIKKQIIEMIKSYKDK